MYFEAIQFAFSLNATKTIILTNLFNLARDVRTTGMYINSIAELLIQKFILILTKANLSS